MPDGDKLIDMCDVFSDDAHESVLILTVISFD